MTGFGKAEFTTKSVRCTAEVTSFNNRFLELSVKLPRQLSSLEGQLRELVAEYVSRGKVSLYIGFEEIGADAAKYHINIEAFRAYYDQLTKIQKKLKIPGQVQINDLVALPEISSSLAEFIDDKKIWPIVEKAAVKALTQMSTMRSKEGSALSSDMNKRLVIIKQHLNEVETEKPGLRKFWNRPRSIKRGSNRKSCFIPTSPISPKSVFALTATLTSLMTL